MPFMEMITTIDGYVLHHGYPHYCCWFHGEAVKAT